MKILIKIKMMTIMIHICLMSHNTHVHDDKNDADSDDVGRMVENMYHHMISH